MDQDTVDKKCLWVYGALEVYKNRGIIKHIRDRDGNECELMPLGIAEWDQLDSEWQPNDVQISCALSHIAGDLEIENYLMTMLVLFRDRRELFESMIADIKRQLHEDD